jgi:FtsX extracellular domain
VRHATPITMRSYLLILIACVALAAGCGGSSGAADPLPTAATAGTPPDLAKFLQLPVATPSACPSNVSGSTDGRSSPWVGHVDVSVFIATTATGRQIAKLEKSLRAAAVVHKVYFESQREAYEEFQRLYTCWTSVPESQTPASYRIVLTPIATLLERNALVARLVNEPGVDSVSCDPEVPCTQYVRTKKS